MLPQDTDPQWIPGQTCMQYSSTQSSLSVPVQHGRSLPAVYQPACDVLRRQLRERRTQAEAVLASVSHRRGPVFQGARESTLSPHQQRKAATAAALALRGVTFRQGDVLQLVRLPYTLAMLHIPWCCHDLSLVCSL